MVCSLEFIRHWARSGEPFLPELTDSEGRTKKSDRESHAHEDPLEPRNPGILQCMILLQQRPASG